MFKLKREELIDDIWVLGNWVEHGTCHFAMELRKLAKWGKDDRSAFEQNEFEMSEHKPNESDHMPVWRSGMDMTWR